MKQLSETDYLISLSKTLLLEHGQTSNQDHQKELNNLLCVKLDGLFLKNIAYLEYCRSLKICSLANNYLTNIDALAFCPHLVKLDLHGNQIVQLPGEHFWAGLKNLQLLYLHDNNIAGLENAHSLYTCSNLVGLTMYDTPLSLKKSYRHCTVNAIWSLKALDNYVISDEEIIEGWSLPDKFKALHPRLQVDLLPVNDMGASFQDEMKLLNCVVSKINQILAHNSPALIVQRWIRGYLTRKRLGKMPLLTKVSGGLQLLDGTKHIYSQNTSSVKDDRRSAYGIKSEKNMQDENYRTTDQSLRGGSSSSPASKMMHLTVSLTNIPHRTIQDVEDVNCCMDVSGVEPERNKKHAISNDLLQQRKHTVQKKQMKLIQEQIDNSELMEAEQKKIQFRLSGFRVNFYEPNRVRNMLLYRKENGKDIRHAIQQFHSLGLDSPKPKKPYLPPVTLERRLFARSYGSLSLAPFETVEKVYKERQRREMKARKMDWVRQIHIAKAETKSHIQGFLEEKKRSAHRIKENDGKRIQGILEQRQLSRSQFIKKSQEKHVRFLEWKRMNVKDYLLVQNFNCQHSSVAEAILKHDRWVRQEDILQEATQMVKANRELQGENKDLLKKYLEQRKLMLQAQNIAEKVELDGLLLEESNERLLQARERVATLKTCKTTMEMMYPQPVNQNIAKETSIKQFSHFEDSNTI